MLTVKQGLVASLYRLFTEGTRRIIGIASLIVLARVLTPEDFGLVAIALIFHNFIDMMSKSGGRQYLLSREILEDDQVYTNWTINFIFNNFLSLTLACSSVFIASFYDDPRLIPLILVLALQNTIVTLESPFIIYKHKNQELKKITQWLFISRIFTTVITVAIAVIYQTYWALVIGQFLVSLSKVLMSYAISPSKPVFTLTNFKQQWDFCKWILPQSLVNFVKTQIDAIYASATFEKAILGAYNSIRYYGTIPATMIIQPAFGTFLAQASQFKNNQNYFAKQLEVVFYVLGLVCAPLVYFMYYHHEFIVYVILGEQWVEYSFLLAIFSFFTITYGLNAIVGNIAMLKSKTSLLLLFSVITILIQIVVFWWVEFESIYQLAGYKMVIDVFTVLIFFMYVCGILVSTRTMIMSIILVLKSATLVILCGLLASSVTTENEYLGFIMHILVTSITYTVLHIIIMACLRTRLYPYQYIYSFLGRFLSQKNKIKKM